MSEEIKEESNENFDEDLFNDFTLDLPNPIEEEQNDPEPEIEKEINEKEELGEIKQESKESTPQEITQDESPLTEREKILLARLEEIQGKNLETLTPAAQLELKEIPKDEFDFIGNEDIDEVLSSKENLNKLLQSVYQRGLSEASKLSAESVMQSLPRVVTQYISQHLEMRQTVDKFYSDNPDLSSVKRTVAAVANEISANNPELSTEEVFKRTADQTRVMLRLRKPTTTVGDNSNSKIKTSRPAFTGQKGRMKVPELNGLAKEISELIEL